MMTLEDFKAARSVLAPVLNTTELVQSAAFSKATGNHVYLKPENMQVTGAYKIRGAYYKISTLSEEQKARGLVTASAAGSFQEHRVPRFVREGKDRSADPPEDPAVRAGAAGRKHTGS